MHNSWKQIHEISKCTKDGIISTNTEKKHRINLTLNLSTPKQYGLPVSITADVFGKH